ncbi:uncharacterized protein LOC128331052 [Hemicordylus capensis]|uniref:uncharacterized protein LOC128331052 n=1 Tax=Hemicordylus capensis TaxID=884348 RepID=UPI00230468FE|nr:uncharacterized protein LOC128331052 [Hemicordylus capensis]
MHQKHPILSLRSRQLYDATLCLDSPLCNGAVPLDLSTHLQLLLEEKKLLLGQSQKTPPEVKSGSSPSCLWEAHMLKASLFFYRCSLATDQFSLSTSSISVGTENSGPFQATAQLWRPCLLLFTTRRQPAGPCWPILVCGFLGVLTLPGNHVRSQLALPVPRSCTASVFLAPRPGALFATHWCLGKAVDDTDLGLCNSTGELPAPSIFLNKASVQEEESVSLLCIAPQNLLVTRFFICKNGHPISSRKATSNTHTYILHISQESAGQYSCGYQNKYGNNQEKTSALSVAQKLMVLPNNKELPNDSISSTGNHMMPLYIWILRSAVVLLLLFSAPIFNFFLKKGSCFLV